MANIKNINKHSGFLGIVIFHLLFLIVMLSFKINVAQKSVEEPIVIDFDNNKTEQLKEEKPVEIPTLPDEIRRNIAVNAAKKIDEEISTEKYIEQLKEELDIKDPANDWKEKLEAQLQAEEKPAPKPEEKPDEKEFAGPTNITYFMENRKGYIHNPVYRCQGSATIVVDITIDQQGNITSTNINREKSRVTDECFVEEAIRATLKSGFSTDYSAPLRQKGYITFSFVSQ